MEIFSDCRGRGHEIGQDGSFLNPFQIKSFVYNALKVPIAIALDPIAIAWTHRWRREFFLER